MFKVLTVQEVASQFRPYLQTLVSSKPEDHAYDFFDLATYADCPARYHRTQRDISDLLETFDLAVPLAATDKAGFEKTYAIPPATLEETVLVCPGCSSVGPARLCTQCRVNRRAECRRKPFRPATTVAKLWRHSAERSQKHPLTPAMAEKMLGCAKALHQDPAVAAIAAEAKHLIAILAEWHDPVAVAPVRVRCLLTAMPEPWSPGEAALLGIVTCSYAHPTAFAYHVFRRALHVRAALEIDLCAAAGFPARNKYLIAGVEATEPHIVARRMFTADSLVAGREVYETALRNLAVSRTEGFWPDYDTGGRSELGWSEIDPEDALHNSARALICPPLSIAATGRAVAVQSAVPAL